MQTDVTTKLQKQVSVLVDFVQQTGRLPMRSSDGHEGLLARWLANRGQRYMNGKMSPEHVDLLKASHPLLHDKIKLWNEQRTAWDTVRRNVTSFVMRNKRLPDGCSTNPAEKELARCW